MKREWTQDEIDDQVLSDDDIGCHHGIGFDENCEWCEMEIQAEEQLGKINTPK